ncbi:MAG TPA: ABC transporter substrate-binding protein, partial [Aestuariivirgaceae bacterium]
ALVEPVLSLREVHVLTRSSFMALMCAAIVATAMPAAAPAAEMIGNCELSGAKGSHAVANPLKPGQVTVAVSLPAPIWWNGDTPESIKDGMEYCMAAEMAWRAGYDKLEVVNVGWDPLVTGQTKDFDFALSEISITDERKKVVDFSVPYFSSDIGLLVKAGTELDESSIKDKTVGVQQATTGAAFAMDTLKLTKVQVYPDQGNMFTALAAGQIDVAMTDTSIVLAEELKSQGKEQVIAQYKTGETYGALYPKGSSNNAGWDAVIQSMIDDGTISKLADKYLASVWGKDPAKVPYFKH